MNLGSDVWKVQNRINEYKEKPEKGNSDKKCAVNERQAEEDRRENSMDSRWLTISGLTSSLVPTR